MSTNPSAIHPEYDRPTPDNLDDWSDEQLEAYNEATEAELDEEARNARTRLTDEQEQALEQLRPDTETEHVELPAQNNVTVEVKTHTNAEIEAALQAITDAASQDSSDLREIRESMITVLCGLIETEDFNSAEFWRAYGSEFGLGNLMRCVTVVAEPVMEEMEAMAQQQSFRQNG